MLTEFGNTTSGEAVHQVEIRGGGLVARFLSYGAVLRDLRLNGHQPPLVLGLNDIEDYQTHSPYFGATAGRCANRIGQGRFQLDGVTHQLDQNFMGAHLLHGGRDGIGKRVWRLEDHSEDHVSFAISLADGHMGFPGAIDIRATFRLQAEGCLDIMYEATCDAPTLCNIAHHSYFNLSGGPDLTDHMLQVDSDHITEVDDELIPTGVSTPVTDTPYDFRAGKSLSDWPKGRLLDHNFCLAQERMPMRKVARLATKDLSMVINTTEPGVQVYDGAKIDVAAAGLDGARYGAHAGIALEPQVWPDAINHAGFPSAVLRPGEVYRQHTQYVFARA